MIELASNRHLVTPTAIALLSLIGCDQGSSGKANPTPTAVAPPTATAAPTPSSTATAAPAASASNAPPGGAQARAKIDALLPELRKIAADEKVKKAIVAQNTKAQSLDEIKKFDAEWIASAGVTEKIKPFLENECARALKAYEPKLPSIAEAFAMDNQGALVCASARTSDYWQGDEDKWKRSFADGKGAEFIDQPKFDESSQTYSIQVSLPVMQDKKAVGAVTVGLRLDKL